MLLTGWLARLFLEDADIFVGRAPGRLDVMGGIADYSGSLVLQLPLALACHAAVQISPVKCALPLQPAAAVKCNCVYGWIRGAKRVQKQWAPALEFRTVANVFCQHRAGRDASLAHVCGALYTGAIAAAMQGYSQHAGLGGTQDPDGYMQVPGCCTSYRCRRESWAVPGSMLAPSGKFS